MKRITFWQRKGSRRVFQEISSRIYFNPDPILHKSSLVAGTARTDTAWVCDLINSQPCHVRAVQPGSCPRVSHLSLLSIHATRNGEPGIPYPCGIIENGSRLGDRQRYSTFLATTSSRYRSSFTIHGFDRNAGTDEKKHAIIWSVSNLVPLKQFRSGELKIVYYEDLCTQLEIELSAIFGAVGEKYTESIMDTINQPFQTTHEPSAVVTGIDKTSNWQKKLNRRQINNILRVVRAFGLGHLYDDSILPLRKDAI